MNTIFYEHIREIVECCLDNIAGNNCDKGDHLGDLKRLFDNMWVHKLKMNPIKSFLGVTSGNFFGFVVTSKGIHLDPEKVRAI